MSNMTNMRSGLFARTAAFILGALLLLQTFPVSHAAPTVALADAGSLSDGYDPAEMALAAFGESELYQVVCDPDAKTVLIDQLDTVALSGGKANSTFYTAIEQPVFVIKDGITHTKLKGVVRLSFTYDVNVSYPSEVDGVKINSPYYMIDFPGFGNLRIYNDRITVLNSSSASGNSMDVKNLQTSSKNQNRVTVILDSENDTYTVWLNDETNISTGPAMNRTPSSVSKMIVSGMQRMAEDAYFRITGFSVEHVSGPAPTVSNANVYQPTDDPVYYYTQPRDENGDYDPFGYEIYGDPMNISDQAFFGEWDAERALWTKQPYLNYDGFSGLAPVESAVKAADYQAAKEALLTYYRGVASGRVTEGSSDSSAKLFLEAFTRNVYPIDQALGEQLAFFEVETNKGWNQYLVDVGTAVRSAKGSYPSISFLLTSVDKFYTTAEIYARESGEMAPTLCLNVTPYGGGSRIVEIPAEKDGMIAGGDLSETVFNGEKIIQIEEHGTYQDYDETTRRAYVAFDISGLSSTDTINSALLRINARSYIPENESAEAPFPKELSCYWMHDSSWTEETLCWDTFPDHPWFSCNDMSAWDYVTSNSPSIKGKVCGYHRGNEPMVMATAYSYYHKKGDNAEAEKYGYNYLRQIMALVNSIGFDTSVMNALDMSRHIDTITQATLRVIDSKYMTPEIFTALMKHQWQFADYLTADAYGKRSNNWATFATGGVYACYARFPEYADHEKWEELTKKEFERVCFDNPEYSGSLVFDDGLCVELSHSYTSTLLGTFYTPMTVRDVTGEPLPYSEKTMKMLERMLEAWALSCGPYFGGFNIGDAGDPFTSYKSTFSRWYYNVFPQNDILAYVATGGAVGKLPDNPTTNFPSGLRTYLRSDWKKDSLQLSFTGKLVGSHGHKDPLSVTMFAYGRYLLTDPGYGAQLTGNVRNTMIAPEYHNTLTVNRGDSSVILSVDSVQKDFKSNSDYDFVEYSSTASTTAELLQRSVTFARDQQFWIVTDYAVPKKAEEKNDFYQNWHLYPGSAPTFADDTKILRTNFSSGANVQLVPVGAEKLSTYTEDTMYSEKSGQFIPTQKGVYKYSGTGNAIFSTIIIPEEEGEKITVTDVRQLTPDGAPANVNAFRFTMERNGVINHYLFYHANEASRSSTITLGSYTTDASTALICEREDGSVASVYLLNASVLKKGDRTVFSSGGAAGDVSITYENQSAVIFSETFSAQKLASAEFSTKNCCSVRLNDTVRLTSFIDRPRIVRAALLP